MYGGRSGAMAWGDLGAMFGDYIGEQSPLSVWNTGDAILLSAVRLGLRAVDRL
jgi:hypothetical protein